MALGYVGNDWQSEEVLDIKGRGYRLGNLYPKGAFDPIADGSHPFLAVGPETALDFDLTKNANTLVGVQYDYNADATRVTLITASGFAAKARIINITAYAAGVPSAYAASVDEGMVVYLDNSASISGVDTTVTLSLSPLDQSDNPNPVAGTIRREQTGFDDSGVGGVATIPFPLLTPGTPEVFIASVMLK